ncbi:UvrD-helicase domain-containing protein [Comamonas sp. wu1-DMT]|uniref:UvrD-helicase domain-containing protein n=1 Tax=Comamonas sp. wu1-DMT TaxID=3126390 RepID=UPI0032E4ACE1
MTTSHRSWKPTLLGKFFTASPSWSLELSGERFTLKLAGRERTDSVLVIEGLTVHRGLPWATVEVPTGNGKALHLKGITNKQAKQLEDAVADGITDVRIREASERRISEFNAHVVALMGWSQATAEAYNIQLRRRGWIGQELLSRVSANKPMHLANLLKFPDVQAHLEALSEPIKKAIDFWKKPVDAFVASENRKMAEHACREDATFFDSVESSPLTDEQRQAVVCFDNRVLLVASAGSGKTSTMVAKAGYALKHGYFDADKMLLLAFNTDAAAELRERINKRLTPLGLPAGKVAAKTFHAFGLEVIGMATGKRPSIASWLDGGQDQEAILAIADDLKDKDPAFRITWDMFRLVFRQDLPKFGKEREEADSWDYKNRRPGFWTLNNEYVKSRGELLIANWLFYNGVKYEYERPYEIDTADSQHGQYHPDFYLTDANAYLEHWGVDQDGEPPKEFVGYKASMGWKRELHAKHGTTLLETTMADLWNGSAFRYLSEQLPKLGIQLDPNPDREVPGRQPIEAPRLANTFRSFLTHVKSNRLSIQDLKNRLESGSAGAFRFRHEMFLRLFEQIFIAWEAKLRAENCIDFEDMLNMATDCVESGRFKSPYELVMVDEFQDASQARSRLVSSLTRGPDRYLFAVGDDWQSINRFAGADLAVMTDFEAQFGKGTSLRLETTFRCPQSLCDISGGFVQKNPSQLKKKVRSAKPEVVEPIRIISAEQESHIWGLVQLRVNEIAQESAAVGKRSKVYVLGRYRKELSYMPMAYDAQSIDLKFITAHSSKGLEADHIIIPGMHTVGLGFPSRVEDDPVLQLAMPSEDAYAHAEERRLFYVAMTRARFSVTLITVAQKESPFLHELVKDHKLEIKTADGETSAAEVCPDCGKGFVIAKKGRWGLFHSCSRYPRCEFKRSLPKDQRWPTHSKTETRL